MFNEVEEFRKSSIICPYCKKEFEDVWEFGMEYDDDSQDYECDECGKEFHIKLSVSHEWTTTGLCDENKAKHNWEYFDHTKDGERTYGRKCLTCGEYEFDKEKCSEKVGK